MVIRRYRSSHRTVYQINEILEYKILTHIAHIIAIRKLVKGTYARHGGDNQVWYIMQADA